MHATTTKWTWTLFLAAMLAAAACGGDDGGGDNSSEAVTPPEDVDRGLPTAGPPDGTDFDVPDVGSAGDYDPEEFPDAAFAPTTPCCPTLFVISDENGEEDELWVHLVGDATPLLGDREDPDPELAEHPGVDMSYTAGVWSVTVCMPPDYAGSYVYEFAYGVPGQSVVFQEINPAAPRVESAGEERNTWEAAESCDDIDVSVHGQTAAP